MFQMQGDYDKEENCFCYFVDTPDELRLEFIVNWDRYGSYWFIV